MNDHSYKKLIILSVSDTAVPERIFTTVTTRIQHSRRVQTRIYGSIHGVLIIGAIVAFIPAIKYLNTESVQSGFSTYTSLILSDGGLVLSNWKDFGLSIAESLPIMSTATCLTILLILTNSIRRGVRYMPRIGKAVFA